VLNAGARFRLDLNSTYNVERPHVDIIAKYIIGRSGLAGLQFHNERFSIGLGYDFQVVKTNVSNTSALELGLTLKKLVIRSKRKGAHEKSSRKSKNTTRSGQIKSVTTIKVKKSVEASHQTGDIPDVTTDQVVADRPNQMADSMAAKANAGEVDHEPLALERATLYFNFKFNSAAVDDDATDYLNGLAVALRDNQNLTIRLVGHTDNVGSEEFNMDLSIQRAQSLKNYLVRHGIDAYRVTVDGKGMTNPLYDNKTAQGREKNRRVELTILYAR